MSADAVDAYLAQGLPEMILNRLSRIDGLFRDKHAEFLIRAANQDIDSSEIGRRLNSGSIDRRQRST